MLNCPLNAMQLNCSKQMKNSNKRIFSRIRKIYLYIDILYALLY